MIQYYGGREKKLENATHEQKLQIKDLSYFWVQHFFRIISILKTPPVFFFCPDRTNDFHFSWFLSSSFLYFFSLEGRVASTGSRWCNTGTRRRAWSWVNWLTARPSCRRAGAAAPPSCWRGTGPSCSAPWTRWKWSREVASLEKDQENMNPGKQWLKRELCLITPGGSTCHLWEVVFHFAKTAYVHFKKQ